MFCFPTWDSDRTSHGPRRPHWAGLSWGGGVTAMCSPPAHSTLPPWSTGFCWEGCGRGLSATGGWAPLSRGQPMPTKCLRRQ